MTSQSFVAVEYTSLLSSNVSEYNVLSKVVHLFEACLHAAFLLFLAQFDCKSEGTHVSGA